MEALLDALRGAERGQLSVSLDIDVTIADIYAPMLDELNKKNAAAGHPTNYRSEDVTNYNWSTVGSKWKGEMDQIYNYVWLNRPNDITLLIDPAKLHELRRHIPVNLVTQKDDHTTAEATRQWLVKHGLDGLDLHILTPGQNRLDMGFRFYIDDNPSLAEKITTRDGKTLFLVFHQCNDYIQEDGKKIIKVSDANQAFDQLLEVIRKPTAQKHRLKGV